MPRWTEDFKTVTKHWCCNVGPGKYSKNTPLCWDNGQQEPGNMLSPRLDLRACVGFS
jgi:hypothetical protein